MKRHRPAQRSKAKEKHFHVPGALCGRVSTPRSWGVGLSGTSGHPRPNSLRHEVSVHGVRLRLALPVWRPRSRESVNSGGGETPPRCENQEQIGFSQESEIDRSRDDMSCHHFVEQVWSQIVLFAFPVECGSVDRAGRSLGDPRDHNGDPTPPGRHDSGRPGAAERDREVVARRAMGARRGRRTRCMLTTAETRTTRLPREATGPAAPRGKLRLKCGPGLARCSARPRNA